MIGRIALVGASGRVGGALHDHLTPRFEVVPIGRRVGESPASLARRAVGAADVVVNAAGVAHVERPTPADLERLRVGNVELPLALASAALDRRLPMIHVSSVKAADDTSTPYAASKREADQRLEQEFGAEFAGADTCLFVVRPFALLFPPLDAGKLRRLSFLTRWPAPLTPPVRLPVLAPATFLAAVEELIEAALAGSATGGVTFREFARSEWGSLRDVRSAFLQLRGRTDL